MNKENVRYSTIYEEIKEHIISGLYPLNSLLPTEQEFSKQYQVNRSTLRKAMQMLADEGFIKKSAGKGTVVLRNTPSSAISGNTLNKNIGFLLPKSNIITAPFYSNLFSKLESILQKYNYSLIYTTLEDEDDLFAKITPLGLSGAIFVSNVSKKHLEMAAQAHLPSVLANSYSPLIPSVLSDNRRGAYLAGKYLIDNGHRDILVLGGRSTYLSNQERLDGIKDAFSEINHIIPEDKILMTDSWDTSVAENLFSSYIEQHRHSLPTAVFAMNDRLATGALSAIMKACLSTPQDISIVGYDNLPYYDLPGIRITSIEAHIDIIAEAIANNIHWQLQGGNVLPVKILAPVTLVEGGTVKKINKIL